MMQASAVSALCLPLAVVAMAGQAPEPALVIVHPGPDMPLAGPSRLEVEIAPASVMVRRVTFFVDGQQACQVETRPFQCEWDAGSRTDPRIVRVVADLGEGRLVATRRTSPGGLTFSTSTSAVLVPVRVTDARGAFVRGLDATRFRIYEDGRSQHIASVVNEDVPASILLALDTSASMRAKLPDLQRAAALFLDAVRDQDTVSLAGFSERLFTLTPQTDDRGAQRRALDQLQAGGETALYDSLIRAAGLVRTQPSPRAIVAFTDGGDVVSRAAVQTVRSALQAADVVLYLIVGADAPAAGSPLAQLARIASETGGDAWFAPRMDTLGRHFTDIARDLSGGYLLSYLPDRSTGDGTWRELRVELVDAGRGHRVRARQGYIATGR